MVRQTHPEVDDRPAVLTMHLGSLTENERRATDSGLQVAVAVTAPMDEMAVILAAFAR